MQRLRAIRGSPVQILHVRRYVKPTMSREAELQKSIKEAASHKPTLVDVNTLLEWGTTGSGRHKDTMTLARFLREELPVRFAHRIREFQSLPFIVGCNPYIKSVYEQQLMNFEYTAESPPIENATDLAEFRGRIIQLLDQNKDAMHLLAQGFSQCRSHMSVHELTRFTDALLKSRIGVRLMAEHFIAMDEEKPGFIGIVCTHLSAKLAIQKVAHLAGSICEQNFGVAPRVTLHGSTDATFPFIPAHLDYILLELFKNAFRASCEHARLQGYDVPVPDIEVTICKGQTDITIRISDQGGGISEDHAEHVFEYAYTTASEHRKKFEEGGFALINVDRFGPMAGLGFGLPMTRVYAEYLGGGLEMATMHGYGTDVYLRLNHIGNKVENQASSML